MMMMMIFVMLQCEASYIFVWNVKVNNNNIELKQSNINLMTIPRVKQRLRGRNGDLFDALSHWLELGAIGGGKIKTNVLQKNRVSNSHSKILNLEYRGLFMRQNIARWRL